jgi:dTDP-L-rhamnose 4-epimerase
MNILITGGAGFIGSHLARGLAAQGASISVYDAFDPQVHRRRPRGRSRPGMRLVVADVRDRAPLARELGRADAVVHFAAAVGVGQSQYRIHHYVDANLGGTAMLLDILANARHRVRKILVAGSMSSYGEGAYDCRRCGRVRPSLRAAASVRGGHWDPACPACGGPLRPLPTSETDRFVCNSVYAITKMAQEELVLNFGAAYGVPAVALRFFNVYGPGQSLSNPYTGVAAIFMSRFKNGQPPVIYEDGLQTRDFVSVHDIVEACRLALRSRAADGRAFNVGTGNATSILALAERLAERTGARVRPKVLRKFRSGDIRHCFADISAARAALGYRPRVPLDEGLRELVEWSASAEARDEFSRAQRELARRGLV